MLPNHASLVIAEQFGTLGDLYPGTDRPRRRPRARVRTECRAAPCGTTPAEEDFPRQVDELLAYLAPAGPGQRLIAYPGAGTNVPVWLLGSSTYSAQLAAATGIAVRVREPLRAGAADGSDRDLSRRIQARRNIWKRRT